MGVTGGGFPHGGAGLQRKNNIKAREDLPEPDKPVITISLSCVTWVNIFQVMDLGPADSVGHLASFTQKL